MKVFVLQDDPDGVVLAEDRAEDEDERPIDRRRSERRETPDRRAESLKELKR